MFLPLQKNSMSKNGKKINGKALSQKDVEKMLEEAAQLVSNGEFEEAEVVAEKLLQNGVKEGYDVLAIVLFSSEKYDEALEVLKEGLAKYKNDLQLLMALGNVYMALEMSQEAIETFTTALNTTQDEYAKLSAEMYIGEVSLSVRDYERVYQLYEKYKNSDMKIEFATLYLTALGEEGKFEEMFRFEKSELAKLEKFSNENFVLLNMSLIYLQLSKAYQRAFPEKKERAEDYLRKAIAEDRSEPDVVQAFREFRNLQATAKSKYFTLTVQGEYLLSGEDEPLFFETTYEVVADSVKEASELIRDYESSEVISFEVVESVSESSSEELKGLYAVEELLGDGEEEDDLDF
jgi:tetratricopeptide (TPR) repeat protein